MATMLVFNMDGARRAKLNMICMRHKIRIRPVADDGADLLYALRGTEE